MDRHLHREKFEETRVMPPYAYVGSSSTSTERAERARLLAAGVSPRLASARGGAGAGEANTAGRPGSSSARGTNSSGAFSARVYYGAAAATNAQKLVSGAATHRAPRPPRYAIKPNNTIHEKESTRTKIHTSTDTNNTRTHTHKLNKSWSTDKLGAEKDNTQHSRRVRAAWNAGTFVGARGRCRGGSEPARWAGTDVAEARFAACKRRGETRGS